MIQQQKIDEVLAATDIVSVIGRKVNLKKTGRTHKGCCPFHDEKTPSFVVYENSQTFHCFGCGEGGNAINFLMKTKNMSFVEAIKELAKDKNIEITDEKISPEEELKIKEQESQYLIYDAATKFFQSQLSGSPKMYALKRFNQETISRFRIGYAPDSWDSLYKHLKKEGYSEDLMRKSELFRQNKSGGWYDFFRNRLMFPIFNRVGKIVSFSGRDLSEGIDIAKYQNGSETSIFSKRNILYGLNFAIPAIRKYDVAIIVEGNPDLVKLHQLGVCNVVAPGGTALSDEQINIISRYTKNFCFLYDSDKAGQEATKKNSLKVVKAGFTALILTIPQNEKGEKQDPDSFFKSSAQFAEFFKLNKKDYLISEASNKAENCENDAAYTAKTVKELSSLFYKKTESERAALIDQLSKIIKPKSLWTKAIKELEEDDKKEVKITQENGRTAEQNKSIEKYGFYQERNRYYFVSQKNGNVFYQGSNFVLEPLFHIESTINAKRLYKLTNEFGISRVVEFPQKDLISIAAFKLRCESLGNFRFDGGDYGLSKIKAYLYEKTKTCKEIVQLGWQKQNFWAWSNGILSNNRFQEITSDGIVIHNKENYYLPALSNFYETDEMLFQFERKFKHHPGTISIYDWLQKFITVYGENAIAGFSFYIACLFRDVIVNYFRFFPLLNMFGPKGTGKSEMAVSLSKLFGDMPVGLNMTNSTIAAIADHVSKTRNAICHIEEYKNSVDYEKVEFLKGLWDGTGRNRMNMDKDKKKEMTAVDSGIMLTGQEMPTIDIALFSRVIFLSFTKTKFSEQEQINFNELKTIENSGLTQITNEILTHRSYFVEHYLENYNGANEDMGRLLNKTFIEDRIWRNFLVIIASLRTIRNVVELPFSYSNVIKFFAKLIERQNNETKSNNEISNFWDIFVYMVREGIIENGYDFKIETTTHLKTDKVDIEQQKEVLLLELSRILQLYSKHGNTTKQKLLPIPTLKYYLENSTEYLGKKKTRLKRRVSLLQDRASTREIIGDGSPVKVENFVPWVFCFDYDALDLDITTCFLSEEENTEILEHENAHKIENEGLPY